MKLAFLGTGEFAVPALRALHAAGHDLHVVISQPDRPTGRGLAVRPTAVHAASDALGLPHVQTADANALEFARIFAGVELGVVVAFGQKLGAALLASLPCGFVNIHGSLLPRYRGAAPIQWAVINGERETGVTVFQINERWDAGAIWGQRRTVIGETETADELHDRLAVVGAALIVDVLAQLAAGAAQPLPQDATQATRAPKLTRADSLIDWTQPAERIVHRILGLWSWPAATCTLEQSAGRRETVQLARARIEDTIIPSAETSVPGSFAADLSVQCGVGRVRLLEVKPAGGKRMSFQAYANGRRIAAGDRLGPASFP